MTTCARHAEHTGPGKFEGASCATYALWAIVDDADWTKELPGGGFWAEFQLAPSERHEYGVPADQRIFRLYEDSNGAVYEVSWAPTDDDDTEDPCLCCDDGGSDAWAHLTEAAA